MIATLGKFGVNAESIWVFAAGVLAFTLVLGIILVGITLMRELLK